MGHGECWVWAWSDELFYLFHLAYLFPVDMPIYRKLIGAAYGHLGLPSHCACTGTLSHDAIKLERDFWLFGDGNL